MNNNNNNNDIAKRIIIRTLLRKNPEIKLLIMEIIKRENEKNNK